MANFFNVISPPDAISLMSEKISSVGFETVYTEDATGRTLAKRVVSEENSPSFNRSSMDGYSVRASDTYGASDALPAYVELVGEIPMGSEAFLSLSPGEAATAYTGGMLANNADAVVMVEHTKITPTGLLEVYRPVASGENVIMAGEDFQIGDSILAVGTIIGHAELGALMSLGITSIQAYRSPKVAVISSGDELVPPKEKVKGGMIRDINLYTIGTLVEGLGALPTLFPRVPDEFNELLEVAKRAIEISDMVVFTAGSSISSRDLTAQVINKMGSPGVLVHGLSVKPGKPTILGFSAGKPIIGLPGNPVSAITIFKVVVDPLLRLIAGQKIFPGHKIVEAILNSNLPSTSGRTDYVRVQLKNENGKIFAVPVHGKSNLISTILGSDGYVEIDSESSGIYKDTLVKVYLD
ncbi:MAG: molybdopterin molybdotransferase [Chloroflexi bacterium]|jgi:molybdopterin molybdotransferase|nr:MAG: molybdopterin molybdotransferase [Chloroflexota bacterium]